MDQLSVYAARGLLVESTDATWLYGTSVEHCVFYQYNFHNAENIFAGMLQTEPPYFQPTPKAPNPFAKQVGHFAGDSDPKYNCDGSDFDGCDTAWAVILTGSKNILIAGAGTYSWFDTYTQECIGKQACQKALWFLSANHGNVRIQHLITIGAKYMIVSDGKGVLAKDNLATGNHPKWSQITVYDAESAEDKAPQVCGVTEYTFQLPQRKPLGEYYPSIELGSTAWEDSTDRSKIYITIVNLTPYTFNLYRKSYYQMDAMDFGDILPGNSRQNIMDYFGGRDGNPKDDHGEAYYTVGDTGKTFVIKATHRIGDKYPYRPKVELSGFGNGARDVEFAGRGAQRAVNLVITGSEKFGYVTSMYPPPVGWMQYLKDVIGPRTVNHVVMPGSHDAGMSVIGKYVTLGICSLFCNYALPT